MRPMEGSKHQRALLYETVARQMADLVEEGTFKPGERIPSIRDLSRQMRVSVNTVKQAYGYLEDRRIIEARPQSGNFIKKLYLTVDTLSINDVTRWNEPS